MKKQFAVTVCALLSSSCAGLLSPEDQVRDRETAIKIGRVACFAKANPEDIRQDEATHRWRANPYFEYWLVQLGTPGPPNRSLVAEVLVAKRDGKAGECSFPEE